MGVEPRTLLLPSLALGPLLCWLSVLKSTKQITIRAEQSQKGSKQEALKTDREDSHKPSGPLFSYRDEA